GEEEGEKGKGGGCEETGDAEEAKEMRQDKIEKQKGKEIETGRRGGYNGGEQNGKGRRGKEGGEVKRGGRRKEKKRREKEKGWKKGEKG
ncbi:hypothetical protein, partial [Escherichia coli]|uniref:hypothetical protein n=1 Tax=Escherichia coli TaxID=562 RepID=UPI001BC8357A